LQSFLFKKANKRISTTIRAKKPEYETTLVFAVCLWSMLLFSQAKVKDTVTRRASIGYNQKGISFLSNQKLRHLSLLLVHLNPVIPIYELGDGHYSKEAEPKHTYKKKGTYTSIDRVTIMTTETSNQA
jgi:hypothetical protein